MITKQSLLSIDVSAGKAGRLAIELDTQLDKKLVLPGSKLGRQRTTPWEMDRNLGSRGAQARQGHSPKSKTRPAGQPQPISNRMD